MTLLPEERAVRVLWSLGMLGRPHQVKLLLHLLGREGVFTIPGLARVCGVRIGLANYFVASLVGKGVVVALPRPEEPLEWGEVYGQVTLNKKRREAHIIGPVPYRLDRARLRALASERCSDSEVLGFIREASV